MANDGHVAQVDDQFASVQVLAYISPRRAKLSNPGSDERSLHDQLALRRRIDDGNPEHALVANLDIASCLPNPGCRAPEQAVESIGDGERGDGMCRKCRNQN